LAATDLRATRDGIVSGVVSMEVAGYPGLSHFLLFRPYGGYLPQRVIFLLSWKKSKMCAFRNLKYYIKGDSITSWGGTLL
jgi:hypothetical protein